VPRVTVVVLNHENLEATQACLAAVGRNRCRGLRVVVVDTGALPGAGDILRRSARAAELVSLGENRGYAGGSNAGLKVGLRHRPDWLLVLNDDVILADDCIEKLVATVDGDPRIGMAGPTVLHRDAPDTVQSAGGRLARDWSAETLGRGRNEADIQSTPRSVDWLSGCALMVRRELCQDVGLLDERYFWYWEEVDWCLRARRSGWQVVHVPGARVWHSGGQLDIPSELATYYTTRNHLLALKVHRAPPLVWCRCSVRLLATVASWSIRPKWRARRANARAMRHGIRDFVLGRFGERR
jgi:GT2 family glycosyltransferase